MSNDREDVGKGPKTPKDKLDKTTADNAAKKSQDTISDEELGKASGGVGRPIVGRLRDEDGGPIPGPSWVNLMAYRKAGWGAEAPRWRSVKDVYKELSTEPADED
jgi:hypothetical protein